MAMEFSDIFGFLKILSRSIQIILENAKSIAVITILSLLPSSILFLLFNYLYQSATTYITDTIINSDPDIPILRVIACFTLLFSVQLIFLYAFFAITHASGIATILASLSSYFPNKLSLQDLCTSFKAKWKIPIRKNLVGSRNPTLHYILCVFAVGLGVPLVMFYPNPLAITIVSFVGVSIFIFQLYASVVLAVAHIIPVVEDVCEGAEALERAEKLVEGQRLHGFMVNLFINLLYLIVAWGFWMIAGDKGSFDLMVYGLFIVNSLSLVTIFIGVVHTVYYFQCMEYHNQKIHLLWNFQFYYTAVSNDIP